MHASFSKLWIWRLRDTYQLFFRIYNLLCYWVNTIIIFVHIIFTHFYIFLERAQITRDSHYYGNTMEFYGKHAFYVHLFIAFSLKFFSYYILCSRYKIANY